MKDSLKAGLTQTFRFKIPETKTVPHLYPESDVFRQMPAVLATGFMVGLMECACIEVLRKLGCDEIQGYLLSKPLPAEEFAARFLAPAKRKVRKAAASARARAFPGRARRA